MVAGGTLVRAVLGRFVASTALVAEKLRLFVPAGGAEVGMVGGRTPGALGPGFARFLWNADWLRLL